RPVYLPEDEMAQAEVQPKMIIERRFSPGMGELMLSLVDRARELFYSGEPLIGSVPWPLNLELAVTWEAGMALLDMIEELGGDTLRTRPSLGLGQWARCFRRAVGHVLR
ncbi:MAG: squalene/phytoene synthase family protein, partial [Magnetococcales bacterium]|nr:squalene/phytoene synthase family protein [Magnetococcales bacterium]